ncbi:hypothetical protein TNCV_1440271 [Trichonephila clavipes]|nr:hypothetical protein TNCV_1440271 [Trichonephila clavipes]
MVENYLFESLYCRLKQEQTFPGHIEAQSLESVIWSDVNHVFNYIIQMIGCEYGENRTKVWTPPALSQLLNPFRTSGRRKKRFP